MCELLAVVAAEPRPMGAVLDWAKQVERLGVAGFGWGVAWLEPDGDVEAYRDPGSLREDPQAASLASVRSSRFLIHLRRPSRLSTVSLEDTQPFVAGGWAFCHNGEFRRHEELRPRYGGLLQGAADSEVGYRVAEELLESGSPPEAVLPEVHRRLEGGANLGYLDRGGAVVVYGVHPSNNMWTFTIDDARVAATALHSGDESLFDLLFTSATNRKPLDGVATLQPQGPRDPQPVFRAKQPR
jgi:hypothetical protein